MRVYTFLTILSSLILIQPVNWYASQMTVSHRHILIHIKLNFFWEAEGFLGNLWSESLEILISLQKSFCLSIYEFNHSPISYHLYEAIK